MKLQDVDVRQIDRVRMEDYRMGIEMEASDDIRTRIAATMGLIERVKRNRYDAELDKVGLTSTQVQVLLYIFEWSKSGEEITARQLEKQFQVSNPTMSGILKRLEKKDFIERQPGRIDKRNKQILIKGEMEQLDGSIKERVAAEIDQVFRGFSREEMEQLLQLVTKLLHNIKEVRNEE